MMSNSAQRYVKYVKMQKLLPEGAVRQRMLADGFIPAEIDDFVVYGPPTGDCVPTAPIVSNERKEKYLKMQQMLPEGAVRQKMAADGLSHGQVYAFFTTSTASDSPSDVRCVTYTKMKKMLPEGAVRQKMAADGLTAVEVDAFFDSGVPINTAVCGTSMMSVKRHATYSTMLQILPECVVRQRMAVDGVSQGGIDAFFNASSSSATVTLVPSSPDVTESRFEKYERMLKMVPNAAVRQKMVANGFSPIEADAFISHGPPVGHFPAPADLITTVLSEQRKEKYTMMLRMLPVDAVRQKMCVDGIATAHVDAFLCTATAPGVDPRYSKYDKMLQMFPEGLVRQKMCVDGFSSLEIDAFISHGPPLAGSVPSRRAATAVTAKRRATYAKMLEMLPQGAVRQKMVAEGCDAAQIDAFFSGGAQVGLTTRGA